MTPQELMDLPYAGMAESKLRDYGEWRVCINDIERMDWLEDKNVTVKTENDGFTFFDGICGDYYAGGVRWAIDSAAEKQYMNEEEKT